MNSVPWYTLRDESGDLRVALRPPDPAAVWAPNVLSQRPLPPLPLRGRRVVLTGRGSSWMYAAVGAWAEARGAADIGVDRPQDREIIWLNAYGKDASPTDDPIAARLIPSEDDASGLVLEFGHHVPEGLLPAAAWSWYYAIHRHPERRLLITGRGSMFHYAAAAALGVRADMRLVACHSPIEQSPIIVVWSADTAVAAAAAGFGWWPEYAVDRQGLVLGIVGDPNSGKSVLSLALYESAVAGPWRSGRYDCDLVAATSPWYLEMQAQHGEIAAKALRKQYKRTWTAELIETAKQRLQIARRHFDVVIADFPGGRHNVTPVQRIPKDRESLFQLVDVFVVLGKAGTDAETEWIEALDRIGLADRIAARIISRDPHDPPFWDVDLSTKPPYRGSVTGLDRPTPSKPFSVTLSQQVAPFLETIMQGRTSL